MGLFSRKDGLPKFAYHNGGWYETDSMIFDRWTMLAGLAWSGYQLWGRGAVVLDHDNDADYVSASRPELVVARYDFAAQLRRDCARYHPEREFVLVCTGARDEKAIQTGKTPQHSAIMKPPMKGMVTPPQAREV